MELFSSQLYFFSNEIFIYIVLYMYSAACKNSCTATWRVFWGAEVDHWIGPSAGTPGLHSRSVSSFQLRKCTKTRKINFKLPCELRKSSLAEGIFWTWFLRDSLAWTPLYVLKLCMQTSFFLILRLIRNIVIQSRIFYFYLAQKLSKKLKTDAKDNICCLFSHSFC